MKDISPKLFSIFVAEHREHVARIRELLSLAEAVAAAGEHDELLRRAHTLKGAARTVGLAPVETLSHGLESVFSRAREGTLRLDEPARAVIHRALDVSEDLVAAAVEGRDSGDRPAVLEQIENLLDAAPRPASAPPPPVPAPVEPLETMRVNAEDLDRLLRSATELLAECLGQGQAGGRLRQLSRHLQELERDWSGVRRAAGAARAEGRSRSLEAFDQKMRAASVLARSAQLAQQRSAWSLARLAGQLEQNTARVRMVPAEGVFEPFRKMVRDLARDQGKEAEFRAEGLETQADRLALQALKDPVMHLLRNAVCHGIESPRQRLAAGKPAAGRILLRVEARGDRLSVSVEDDGRGIDLQAVAAAAVRGGLISEQEAASRSPDELARLIWHPGVSTARSVTRLAGRGMGLSVVQEQLRRLQGEVSLRHRDGAGTCVLLSAPLAVARLHVVLAACGDRIFAIPIRGVERLCRIRAEEVRTVEGRETVSFDGRPAPLAKLSGLLRLHGAQGPAEAKREFPAVLLRAGGERLLVLVDALLDERNAVVHEPRLDGRHAGNTTGAVLLEDGRVALLLDPADLWQAFRQAAGEPGATIVVPAERSEPPTILVVDDSITTRSLEKSILEAHGYKVRLAVDGVEALEKLRENPADLVIADILMPRLDGFGLLEEMKRETALAKIPVIIVSSLERVEDRQRGLALGADAYIVKQKFDQRELLDAVRQTV